MPLPVDPSNIKLFKFIHIELEDHIKARDVSPFRGATYLQAYLKDPNFSSNTVNMFIEGPGIAPEQPRVDPSTLRWEQIYARDDYARQRDDEIVRAIYGVASCRSATGAY